jgi:enoyl-CoA hydratase/carnithine racemase
MASHPAYETIKLEIGADKVGIITMNRPEALNAMTTQMMRELRDCFMQFYIDPNQAACLVITGSGDRGFCTGADLQLDRLVGGVRGHSSVLEACRAGARNSIAPGISRLTRFGQPDGAVGVCAAP